MSEHEPARDVNPVARVSSIDSGESPTLDPDATFDSSELASPAPSTGSGASHTTTEPRSMGPYRLIRKIGEGGMGQVWLAEQTAPVRRQVALKLIKVGRFDDEVLQRFQSERQSLAIMDHPSIAKVFDAGSTADGQPYFVMEYVRGALITDYCDHKRLGIRERLQLFIKVCEGVQHAHQNAIIHRDLKPANILVVEVDGKPVPRIIDFGLAKATTPQIASETMFTQVGHFVGTPGYMSPEQADASVLDVDTRTDVYSLGVVLYVLLTGALPFDSRKWQMKPLHEVLRQLREDEPPRPSTRVGEGKESSTATAERRGVQPRQLVNLLHGDDLDDSGHYAEAEKLERKALDISRRVLGPEHKGTLTSMDNLASLAKVATPKRRGWSRKRSTLSAVSLGRSIRKRLRASTTSALSQRTGEIALRHFRFCDGHSTTGCCQPEHSASKRTPVLSPSTAIRTSTPLLPTPSNAPQQPKSQNSPLTNQKSRKRWRCPWLAGVAVAKSLYHSLPSLNRHLPRFGERRTMLD
jgi:serine/threonine protein kinase